MILRHLNEHGTNRKMALLPELSYCNETHSLPWNELEFSSLQGVPLGLDTWSL